MRNKRKKYLDSIYVYESRTNTYAINLSLDNYEEVCNPYDYSQFKKRDLDSDFLDYIYDSSKEIPLNYNIKLIINVKKENKDEEKDSNLKNALKNNYGWREKRLIKELKKGYHETFTFLFVGLVISALGGILNMNSVDNFFYKLIYDGSVVVSWVFLWKAIEMLCFGLIGMIREHRYLKRLIGAKVEFKEY